jgi:manganese/zinc/iron transport system substrate-binding protein
MLKYLSAYLSLVVSIAVLLTGCDKTDEHSKLNEWMSKDGKIKVLSTTGMIDDIVQRVGGDYVDSIVLIKGDLDPHSYQLVKGDDEKLSFADIIFYNGLGLEHGPSIKHYLNNNPKAIGLGDIIGKQYPEDIIYVNGQPDPHIWMDIAMWIETVDPIVDTLSKKDPDHAVIYKKNGELLKEKMSQADEDIYLLLQAIPDNKRYLVTSHDAFNYFARAYLSSDNDIKAQWEARFVAPEGLAPESQISASDIQWIINHLEKYHVTVVFAESNVSKDSLKKIVSAAKEKGLDLRIAEEPLYGDAMGHPGSFGDTYLEMISHNAITIARYIMQ